MTTTATCVFRFSLPSLFFQQAIFSSLFVSSLLRSVYYWDSHGWEKVVEKTPGIVKGVICSMWRGNIFIVIFCWTYSACLALMWLRSPGLFYRTALKVLCNHIQLSVKVSDENPVGTPGNSRLETVPPASSKSWPYFRPKKNVIFHTRSQIRPLKSIPVFRPGLQAEIMS